MATAPANPTPSRNADLVTPDRLLGVEQRHADALIQILKEPKNALVKQYQKLFEMEDVSLTFTDDALRSIAEKAIVRRTGARGLRSIMENILLETMFELPSMVSVEEVVVNREVTDSQSSPLLIYSDRKGDASAS